MTTNVIVSLDEFYREYCEFDTDEYKNICPYCFRTAKNRIKIKNCGRLRNENRVNAIYLLTAHLSMLTYKNRAGHGTGGQGGQVASASVGEVSVSYVQIPAQNDTFSYWLGLTPYGLELLALYDTLTSVPFYIGGSFERVLY